MKMQTRQALNKIPNAPKPVGPRLRPRRTAVHAANASQSYVAPSTATSATELELLQRQSVVVPDSILGESSVKLTAATVSYGLLRSAATSESLGMKPLENAIAAARTFSPDIERQVEKAMANVGALLAERVEGRISTEIDPRLANDEGAIVAKARSLAGLYKELQVPTSRLLFRIPATWAGICAAKQLEKQGLATHLALVFSLVQAVAAAQAGCSLVNPNVGRTRDFFAKHPGVIRDPKGPRQDVGGLGGVDPGVALVTDIFNYMKAHHPHTKVIASGIRTREDALALAGCDYLLLPSKVIQSLTSVPTRAGYNDGLHANSSASDDEVDDVPAALTAEGAKLRAPAPLDTVTEALFKERLGVAGSQLLAAGLSDALKDVEALAALSKATTGTSST